MASISDLQDFYDKHKRSGGDRNSFIKKYQQTFKDGSTAADIGKYWDAQEKLTSGSNNTNNTTGTGGTNTSQTGLSTAANILGGLVKAQESTKVLSSTESQTFDYAKLEGLIKNSIDQDGLNLDSLLQNAIVEIGFGEMEKYLSNQTALLQTINEEMGMTGQLSEKFREEITNATPELERMGISFQDVGDAVQTLYNTTGKFNVLSQQTIEDAGRIGKAYLGGIGELMRMYPAFEKIGFGAANAQKEIGEAGKKALSVGLQAKKTLTDLNTNLGKINEYGFSKGVQGLAEMTRKATEFRMSMDGAFQIAEKVMNPESALEMSANLQVLGGAIGDFNDPMKLMYMATNNVEGLQDALIGAASSLAVYNEEQGRFEIKGANLRRAKEMATQMGVSLQDLTNGAIAFAERTEAANELLAKGLSLDKDTEEFITNISQMRDGKMVVELKGDELRKALNTDKQFVALDELTEKQIEELKKVQESLNKPEDQIIRDQATNIENIERYVSALLMKYGIESGKEAKGLSDKLTGPILEKLVTTNTESERITTAKKETTEKILKKYQQEATTIFGVTNNPITQSGQAGAASTPIVTNNPVVVPGTPPVSPLPTGSATQKTNQGIQNVAASSNAGVNTSAAATGVAAAATGPASSNIVGQKNLTPNVALNFAQPQTQGSQEEIVREKEKEGMVLKTMEVSESPLYKSMQSIESQLISGLSKFAVQGGIGYSNITNTYGREGDLVKNANSYFNSNTYGAAGKGNQTGFQNLNLNNQTALDVSKSAVNQYPTILDMKNLGVRLGVNPIATQGNDVGVDLNRGLSMGLQQGGSNLFNTNQNPLSPYQPISLSSPSTSYGDVLNSSINGISNTSISGTYSSPVYGSSNTYGGNNYISRLGNTQGVYNNFLAQKFPSLEQNQRAILQLSKEGDNIYNNRQITGLDGDSNTVNSQDNLSFDNFNDYSSIVEGGKNYYEGVKGTSFFKIPEQRQIFAQDENNIPDQVIQPKKEASDISAIPSFAKFRIPEKEKKEKTRFTPEMISKIQNYYNEEYRVQLEETKRMMEEASAVNQTFENYDSKISSNLISTYPPKEKATGKEKTIAQDVGTSSFFNLFNKTDNSRVYGGLNFNNTKNNLLSKNRLFNTNYNNASYGYNNLIGGDENGYSSLNINQEGTRLGDQSFYNMGRNMQYVSSQSPYFNNAVNSRAFSLISPQSFSTLGDNNQYFGSSLNYQYGDANRVYSAKNTMSNSARNLLTTIKNEIIGGFAPLKSSNFFNTSFSKSDKYDLGNYGSSLSKYYTDNESDYSVMKNYKNQSNSYAYGSPMQPSFTQPDFGYLDFKRLNLGMVGANPTPAVVPEGVESSGIRENNQTSVYNNIVEDNRTRNRGTARAEADRQPAKMIHEVRMVNPSPFMDRFAEDMMKRLGQYGIGVNHREYTSVGGEIKV